MDNINPIPEIVGETTDVEVWLIRAGLKFSDLGDDAGSIAIRKQWREYQAAVQRCCAILHQPPSKVQLGGDYAKLRIPGGLKGTRGGGEAKTRGRGE
ncbi:MULTISPECIES: hypothetical protein [Nostoc]|uniref:Uncharacterized protein n=1 Tax=Nostoc paludosum FACHB-159 TaxID=2692908 RepID=A0ABR8K8Q2_9NOSO|nr:MULTISPECIES: hypothetical protein [Nostoc]MBD2680242.1 hypothetical protein [Nostoc sp. FACHB-857]MBD2735868.1 hypothetical protein [Nostoc paludosum FACHB-159]